MKKLTNNKIKIIICSLLIISMIVPGVLFSVPTKTNAWMGIGDVNATDAPNLFLNWLNTAWKKVSDVWVKMGAEAQKGTFGAALKNLAIEAFKELKKAIARRVVQEMTKSIVNWINSGYHGSPLFLDNPKSFFKDIVKSEVKTIINTFGYDSVKFPFGRDFALNLMNSYKQTLENNASYSLSRVMSPTEASNYRNNFNYGGWNGFLINTQYPQNNYLGFQMMANEEIVRRINTTTEIVQTALQEGGGFLSPQTCPTNSAYNNGTNEWRKPSFDPSVVPHNPGLSCRFNDDNNPTEDEKKDCEAYETQYKEDVKTAEWQWAQKNTCPGGLQNTTPGKVVGDMVTKALGGSQDQAAYSAMVGNATSAIMDALLNKYINEGLTSLASRINKKEEPEDTWTYDGQQLGGPDDGYNSTWDSGPDEPVILIAFKKKLNGYYIGKCTNIKDSSGTTIPDIENISEDECDLYTTHTWTKNIPTKLTINSKPTDKVVVDYIPGDIANTEIEIKLMNNTDPLNPGILQLIKMIPKQAQSLDQCIPGPDKGWEGRLTEEQNIANSHFSANASLGDENTATAASVLKRDLKFAVTEFKNWITIKMENSLPNATTYLDEIKKIDDLTQQSLEITNARLNKSQALARLKSIAGQLELISEHTKGQQPEPSSVDEKDMITLMKQLKSTQTSISSPTSVEDTRNELNTMLDKSKTLDTMNKQCQDERITAGWISVDWNGKGLGVFKAAVGKSFFRTKIATKLRWTSGTTGAGILSLPTTVGEYIDTLLNYPFPYLDKSIDDANQDANNPIATPSTDTKTGGTEIEQFCELPIISGYSHGEIMEQVKFNRDYKNKTLSKINPDPAHNNYTFRNLNNYLGNKDDYGVDEKGKKIIADYTTIPLVNAQYVLGDKTCTGTCSIKAPGSKESDERKSIELNCGTIFRSREADYTQAGDISY